MQSGFRKIARADPRRGYTLFEILLVMAILVAVGAIAAPIFQKSFEVERLRKGGDTLRTAWAKARVQAMSTGQTHVFQFEYASNQFVVGPWETGAEQTEAAATGTVGQRTGQLPTGIVFYAAEKLADARASAVDEGGAEAAPQIFFYPDGTTSTAQVMLANKHDRFVKVFLRGLTGVPRVGDLVSAEELVE
ncbi:MAG: prepilin-type N-terminal cleavage/methylation domain-containing protein [Pirellulales bacterium]